MHPKLLVNREKSYEIHCGCGAAASFTAFHFHSHLELYLVEDGESDVWINQKHRRLHSGELAVVLSYDAHQYEPAEGTVISYLIVPAATCSELSGMRISDPFISDPALFGEILRCCRTIARRQNPLLTDGCTRVVFGLLLESLQLSPKEAFAEPDSMSRTLLYIQEHFRSRLTLASAASALGFNPSYLSRSFKQSLGIGFNQYLTMLRLREAVFLLSRGNTIDYCAYESGFNSIRTFYRAFSEEFGCTPGEYLKSLHP